MTDFNDLPLESEDLEGATPDFNKPEGFAPMKPGRYVSRSRTHEFGVTSTSKPKVRIKFGSKGAFETLQGAAVNEFPPFEDLYFFKRSPFGGEGEISGVASYLRACGMKYQNWTKEELPGLLDTADTTPVVVIVGWEQDYKEVQERQKSDPSYKAKKGPFFKDSAGNYIHQRKDDTGAVCTAKSKVVDYAFYRV